MRDSGQPNSKSSAIQHDSDRNNSLSEIISPLRLGTYLNASGHDPDRALQLYLWNAQVGESFHIPIQAVEVGLRNRVSVGLTLEFGTDWWKNSKFEQIVESKQLSDIDQVLSRLRRKQRKAEAGQVIAGLSFGFWVAMLDRRYGPSIWTRHLRTSFPNLPKGITCSLLRSEVREIADLRNRIWHHEPIFRRNLSDDHARCLKIVHWLCPVKAAWIKPYCKFPAVLRQKP